MPRMDVDLIWNQKAQTWIGFFERGSFKGHVLLRRPNSRMAANPFVGTWSEVSGITNRCIHIAQAADGSLAVWSDNLQSFYGMRYAKGIEPFKTTREFYGELGTGSLQQPDRIAVEVNAYSAICCPHSFTAKISADHQSLVAPFDTTRSTLWRRMPANSCLSWLSFGAH